MTVSVEQPVKQPQKQDGIKHGCCPLCYPHLKTGDVVQTFCGIEKRIGVVPPTLMMPPSNSCVVCLDMGARHYASFH